MLPNIVACTIYSNCCSDKLSSFMESRGAISPGILTLTTSLSKVGGVSYCMVINGTLSHLKD